jgi:protein TonB
MFNSAPFKIAFFLSLSLHLVAISAGSFFPAKMTDNKEAKIEITYLVPEVKRDEIQEKIIERLPENYDMEEKELQESRQKEEALYPDKKELKAIEDYIHYYELVREKIKKRVAKKYTRFREEGTVEVSFTLRKNGTLKGTLIDEPKSTDKAFLKAAAIKGIKEASPFPAFPASLEAEELAFALAIIFKKQ